jgi:predicted TIM-barrel fold metal-dependent hydrolase
MTTRRHFLGTALGAGLAIALPGCQQMGAQTARKRMIVDCQIHLWKAATPDWPWVPGAKPQLPEPFTIERLLPMMDEAGVDRAIIVPPVVTGDRNDYGVEAAQRYPGRFAVMGRINLRDPKSADLLPKWKAQPGMLGIRLTFLGKDLAMLSDGTADWLWPAAEKAGVPIALLGPDASRLSRIAERHPRLDLMIDHMGLTTAIVAEGRTAAAISDIASLAKYPNCSVKLSATTSYSAEGFPYRDFNSHLRRLFDAYGPQRCYWGTDLTNSLAKATYRQRIAHFTEHLDFLSESDKDWVMGRAMLERLKWS